MVYTDKASEGSCEGRTRTHCEIIGHVSCDRHEAEAKKDASDGSYIRAPSLTARHGWHKSHGLNLTCTDGNGYGRMCW